MSTKSPTLLNAAAAAMASASNIPKGLRDRIIITYAQSQSLLEEVVAASRSSDGIPDHLQSQLIDLAENRLCMEAVKSKQLKKETVLLENKPENTIRLYDSNDVKQRLKLVPDDREHVIEHKILSDMARNSGEYTLRALPKNFSSIMDEMNCHYPHFHNVTEFLRKRMAITQLQPYPALSFGVNLLLDGPPGVGKSSYLMMLSEKMDTLFINLSCASASNSFDITGLSARWGNGRPGKLYEVMIGQDCPNPIILLDEVEKASQDERSNLHGALYGLLEKNNARSFRDEFIDVPIDASKINWFATSNDVSSLDRAIQDRFVILQVEAPSSAELITIIPHLYQELMVEYQLHHAMSPNLSSCIVRKLAQTDGISIRVVKNMLEQALASAAMGAGSKRKRKISLKLDDLPNISNKSKRKAPMGFIW